MARKTHDLTGEHEQLPHGQAVGVKAHFAQALGLDGLAPVAPVELARELVQCGFGKAQRLAHIAQGAARAVADDGSGERGAFAAVFGVKVLDHFFAPLVFKVHIDVRRLVALFGDEALKQHCGARRVHLGDAQAVAHGAVGRRATALAQDVLGTGKGHDVVDGQKVVLVTQLTNERQLVLDLLLHLV